MRQYGLLLKYLWFEYMKLDTKSRYSNMNIFAGLCFDKSKPFTSNDYTDPSFQIGIINYHDGYDFKDMVFLR